MAALEKGEGELTSEELSSLLVEAATYGWARAARALLRLGAQSGRITRSLRSLEIAVAHCHLEVVRAILELDTRQTSDMVSVIGSAVRGMRLRPSPRALDVLDLLLTEVEKPLLDDGILLAVSVGAPSAVVRAMVLRGGSPDVRSPDGSPAVVLSARSLSNECLTELLRLGANVDASDQKGFTALSYAAAANNTAAIAELLLAGANPKPTLDSVSASEIAASWGHYDTALVIDPMSSRATRAANRTARSGNFRVVGPSHLEVRLSMAQLRCDRATAEGLVSVLHFVGTKLDPVLVRDRTGFEASDYRQLCRRIKGALALLENDSDAGLSMEIARKDALVAGAAYTLALWSQYQPDGSPEDAIAIRGALRAMLK
jgi:ankyrin repeat protein